LAIQFAGPSTSAEQSEGIGADECQGDEGKEVAQESSEYEDKAVNEGEGETN
jgi:hypothetical protein